MGWLRKGFSPDKGGRAPRGAVGCSACLVLCFLGFLGLGMGADFGQTAWIRLVSGFPPAAMAAENPLGRAQERTCREVEQRIKTLLSPVYGDGHVVVMASTEDAGKGGHIRAAIIIDTAAMQDVHLSPDGIVAEQNRIVRLVSHAAGLDTASGDSVAVSFLSFSAKKNDTSSMWILLASAGLLCLSAAGWLYLRVKRSQLRSGRPAERNEWRKNDSGGESDISLTQHGSRSRVNRELSVFGVLLARENAQSRAAALTLFPPEQAVRVLGCWPEDEQADTGSSGTAFRDGDVRLDGADRSLRRADHDSETYFCIVRCVCLCLSANPDFCVIGGRNYSGYPGAGDPRQRPVGTDPPADGLSGGIFAVIYRRKGNTVPFGTVFAHFLRIRSAAFCLCGMEGDSMVGTEDTEVSK